MEIRCQELCGIKTLVDHIAKRTSNAFPLGDKTLYRGNDCTYVYSVLPYIRLNTLYKVFKNAKLNLWLHIPTYNEGTAAEYNWYAPEGCRIIFASKSDSAGRPSAFHLFIQDGEEKRIPKLPNIYPESSGFKLCLGAGDFLYKPDIISAHDDALAAFMKNDWNADLLTDDIAKAARTLFSFDVVTGAQHFAPDSEELYKAMLLHTYCATEKLKDLEII